ncbi:MAG: hypothetical protein ACJASQ_002024 [Crocinitomicaceae bacterium]|jgi:hypothetical protein
MNKTVYAVGIALSVIFFFVCGYYFIEAEKATSTMYAYYLQEVSQEYGVELGVGREELSSEIGLWSLLFLGYFSFIYIMGLRKVKTKAMKVSSIIALSLTGIILLWDFGMIISPRSMSFDEIGLAWLGYCFVILILSIVGFIQSPKYNKLISSERGSINIEDTSELLDS